MFKNILSEIHRQKKLMNLTEDEKNIKTVIFGDDVIDNIEKKDLEEIPELISGGMKLKDMISTLKSTDERPEVDHVFFSIGKNDRFENSDLIDILAHRLKEKFPNAKLYAIRSILNNSEYNKFSGDVKENEKDIEDFFKEFKNNKIDVVGQYRILDGESSGKEKKVKSLQDEILNKIVFDVFKSPSENVDLVIKNVDISGEDESDFDTIYEFIRRFEKIIKSNNEYKKNMSSSFKPDIEQIQIVLKFIDQDNDDLMVTGIYDTPTENAIEDFQRSNNLEVTGEADNETLDELFYELKAKGFDELDLAKYMVSIDIDSNIKTGSDIESSYGETSNSGKGIAAGVAAGVGIGVGVSLVDSGRTSKVAGTKSEDDRIYRSILSGIGADDTDENMLFFHAWRSAESAKATYNPFNTTQRMAGSTNYNSVGVKNYPSEKDGIDATVKTLKNGYYPCILDGLRRDIGAKNISKNCLANLKTWGTGDLIFKVLNTGSSFTPTPIYRK